MASVPILAGINTTLDADFSTSYPRNLTPVPKETGISGLYLKLADGLRQFSIYMADITGNDRGAINWNGQCYRVLGQYFIRVNADSSIDTLATLPIGGPVKFDFSFDLLAIACSGRLFYWDGVVLTENTSPNLGTVVDMIWIDGYFMTTDGEFLPVTELNDPYTNNVLKYGAIDNDPSPIKALLKVRNEAFAISRYSISPLQNVGGRNFPFSVVNGAVVNKGAVGTKAACEFMETIAFVGSGLNEQISVYVMNSGMAQPIATREIERILAQYPESELQNITIEARNFEVHKMLYIHLTDQTLVYDGAASAAAGTAVWAFLSSGSDGYGVYRARNFVWCYDRWLCGDIIDVRLIGEITQDSGNQYGVDIGYQFDTMIAYNKSRGAQIHWIELVTLTGRPQYNEIDQQDQSIRRSYSVDGLVWSDPKIKSLGKAGQTKKRPRWTRCGFMRNWRVERFQGRTRVPVAFANLEVEFEGLAA